MIKIAIVEDHHLVRHGFIETFKIISEKTDTEFLI